MPQPPLTPARQASTSPPGSIAVIGAGVVGLTTSLVLRERGAGVSLFGAPQATPEHAFSAGASWVAPALFTPYAGPHADRFERWTRTAWHRWTRIAREHPQTSGVFIAELRDYLTRPIPPQQRHAWLDDLMGFRPIRPVPSGYVDAFGTQRPHMDMTLVMPWLLDRARSAGVLLRPDRVASIDEVLALGFRTVVLCAGLGARTLASDQRVRPMHGQLIHAPNDIGLTCSLHDDAPDGKVTYVFRFGDRLVLGGTFEAQREDLNTDPATLEAIVHRCRELLRADGFPRWQGLARTRTRVVAGVRPTRGDHPSEFERTRVERETSPCGATIIHNYGHGRAGVTLSWGTAEEVGELVFGGR